MKPTRHLFLQQQKQKQRPAFIFSGQGSQSRGFPLLPAFCESKGAAWKVIQSIDEMFREKFDCSLLAVMRGNPKMVHLNGKKLVHHEGLLNNTIFTQPAILTYQQATLHHLLENFPHDESLSLLNLKNSSNLNKKSSSSDNKNEHGEQEHFLPPLLAGHSVGEFSALTAAGVFSPRDGAELVTRRGLAMDRAINELGLPSGVKEHQIVQTQNLSGINEEIAPSHFLMIAVNAKRAMLGDDENSSPEDTLIALIELVANAVASQARNTANRTHLLLELVNDNVHNEQLVVAADRFSGSVLGKCLDPQFRSSCAENGIERYADLVQAAIFDADADERTGVTKNPNANSVQPNFVPGSLVLAKSTFLGHPREITIDCGITLPEEKLVQMSQVGAGRSGLKKRSWFVPIPGVEIPFHSSALRYCFDEFSELVTQFVSKRSDQELEEILTKKFEWIPNITGSSFSSPDFREQLHETFTCCNVGEQIHAGRFVPHSWSKLEKMVRSEKTQEEQENSSSSSCTLRNKLIASLSSQLSHVVCWSSTMDVLLDSSPKDIFEFSPFNPVLSDMVKKAHLQRKQQTAQQEEQEEEQLPNIWTMPRDLDKFNKHQQKIK